MASLITLLVALLIFGALLYIVSMLPIDATIKRIIQVIAIVALAIWLLRAFAPAMSLG